MKALLNKGSKFFEIGYYGLPLNFELFTIEYIEEELNALKQERIMLSTHRLQIPKKNPFRALKKIAIDGDGKEKHHFFAYIKFVVFEGQKYGLVGGKTNYSSPDISFDGPKDKEAGSAEKRIA